MAEHTTAVADTEVVPAAQAVAADFSNTAEMNHDVPKPSWLPVQFKLSLGAVDDPQEVEADEMADKVMRMPASPAAIHASPVSVQRKCAACEQEEAEVQRKADSGMVIRRCAACDAADKEEKVQRKTDEEEGEVQRKAEEEEGEVQMKADNSAVIRRCAACDAADKEEKIQPRSLAGTIRRSNDGVRGSQVSSSVSDSIAATRGGGSAMSADTRDFMESRFGSDFSGVRIHDGGYAANLSNELNAQAFTIGNDIYFNAGKYSPETSSGKHLLAHELTHTLQQGGGGKSIERKPISDNVIRRVPQYYTPQDIGTSRTVDLPVERRGNVSVTPRVTRQLAQCECRRTSDSQRTGWFMNPDLNNFVIAFSYCRNDFRADMYAQLESEANEWLNGRGEPEGRLTVGTDFTFGIGNTVSRITLSGILGNDGSGTGPGSIPSGHGGGGVDLGLNLGLGAIRGQDVRLLLGGNYMNWPNIPGLANPHEWGLRGGLGIGPWSLSFSTTRIGDQDQTYMFNFGYRRETPPERPRCERRACICPPPRRIYTCENLEQEDDTPAPDPVALPDQEIQHYFEYNSTNEPTTEPELVSANRDNLAEVVRQVGAGSTIISIRGYASPEGGERSVNQSLALDRGVAWRNMIRAQVPAGTGLPIDVGRGELLGSAPPPEVGSHLVDLIRSHGFESAAQVTRQLTGAEYSSTDLTREFLALFREITDRGQRLALFGLMEESPLANRVITAVDQYVANNGRGTRPWDRIFQLFRMATVKLRPPMPARGPATPHDAVTVPITGSECDRRQALAERRNLFGPPTRVRRNSSDVMAECDRVSLGGAPTPGCNYSTTGGAEVARDPEEALPAPDIAPVPIGTQPAPQQQPQGPPPTPPLQRP
ncbi:protein of unknown function [Chitinophaga jiangningensis]|uniref:eCIS core domain-containing protein n=1 Tax=Chitinophaga jiangningensis TaxID=1419482 RepID=A0A1M7JUK3_9BACT|nr:DUF4157 domain-containing protein [Chitinophaga jiangningensis]SHM56719.1 protein of unknown function [Chitinophaga jiangningensis]